jgi:uncharacterized RDD family membrane protein YckC
VQTIEIYTSQNVSIEYKLASLRDRLLAYLIDALILAMGLSILYGIAAIAFKGRALEYIGYLIIAPIFFFYTLALEIFNDGQSIGKQALNIKVVKLNGKELNIGDFLVRWVFRMVDIYFTIGSVATMIISSTEKNQRLGDILAGTSVIKNKPEQQLQLNSILEMYSKKKHVVTYPAVKMLTEKDMLLVKEVLDRFKKYPNDSHTQVIETLVNMLVEKLAVNKVPKDKVKFLNILLADYIFITR